MSPETKAASSDIVLVTDTALGKLAAMAREKSVAGVRVGVVGGGCAGLQYQMDPCEAANEGDIVQDVGDIRFFFHPMVVPYLKGVKIDFIDAMIDGGFKFINPNASSTCGCGTSFGI